VLPADEANELELDDDDGGDVSLTTSSTLKPLAQGATKSESDSNEYDVYRL
jgi:hypothetical protein